MAGLATTHVFATLHLNAVRAASAGITFSILYTLGRLLGVVSDPRALSFFDALLVPIALLLIGVAAILAFRVADSAGVPMMGGPAALMSLVMIVFIALGDPLIWIVRKYYPAIVPVERFGFINPHALMMVERP